MIETDHTKLLPILSSIRKISEGDKEMGGKMNETVIIKLKELLYIDSKEIIIEVIWILANLAVINEQYVDIIRKQEIDKLVFKFFIEGTQEIKEQVLLLIIIVFMVIR
jgi:hypothetical protein